MAFLGCVGTCIGGVGCSASGLVLSRIVESRIEKAKLSFVSRAASLHAFRGLPVTSAGGGLEEHINMGASASRRGATFPSTTLRGALWVVPSGVALALCVGFLVGSGRLLPAAGAASILVAAFIAYRWPVAAAMAVLIVSGAYRIFAFVPGGWDTTRTSIGSSVRLEDVFMVGMLVAALIRIANPSGRRRLGRLLAPTLLLGAWLALETLRNVGSVGLSAVGELRFFFLVLSVAFCLVASLDCEARVRTAIKGFVLITVALPVVLLPVVIALKGWSFGPSARVLPSEVSVGLLLGLAVLWQGRDLVRWPRWAVFSVTVVGVLEILVDAHRSVWLSAVVLVGILLLRQPFQAKVRWAFLALLVAVAVMVAAQGLGQDPVSLVVQRGAAVVTLQDTTGLRLSMWKAATPLIVHSPIIGRGLGMYWDLYLQDLGYTVHVFPHSLYVVVLANLGAIGLLLCMWLWLRAWKTCLSVRRGPRLAPGPGARRITYASLGLLALGTLAAYGVSYGFDLNSVTLLGICLAGANARDLGSGGGVLYAVAGVCGRDDGKLGREA
jgi:O-antigen ligase